MAVAFRAAQVTSASSTPVIPAGAVVGDLLLMLATTSFGAVTVPAGWAQIHQTVISGLQRQVSMWKMCEAGEPGLSMGSIGIGQRVAVIIAYSDTHTSAPIAASAELAPTTTSSPAAPSVSVPAGGMLVCGWHSNSDPSSYPGGMTVRADLGQSGGTVEGFGVADEVVSGVSGTRTASGGSLTWAAQSIAVGPPTRAHQMVI